MERLRADVASRSGSLAVEAGKNGHDSQESVRSPKRVPFDYRKAFPPEVVADIDAGEPVPAYYSGPLYTGNGPGPIVGYIEAKQQKIWEADKLQPKSLEDHVREAMKPESFDPARPQQH